jgi:hypothetical protein
VSDLFHQTANGSLDRKYLRVRSVYKMLMRLHRIDKRRAIELLEERGIKSARSTVELWLQWPPQPREKQVPQQEAFA